MDPAALLGFLSIYKLPKSIYQPPLLMDESFRFLMLRKPAVSSVIIGATKPEDAFVTGR